MELGIIGLPKSGKTTVFNALTRGKAKIAAYSSGTVAPNIGVTKVPDPRLESLANIFKPKRTIPADVRYVDIGASPKDFGKGEGLGGQFLAHVAGTDALIHVVRAFKDERVPHIEGSVDPERDIDTMDLELTFSDLTIIERRLNRLEAALKGAKQSQREANLREQTLLKKIKAGLEDNIPIRKQGLTEEQAKAIENYQFLTAKPLLVLVNIGEERLAEAATLEAELQSRYQHPSSRLAVLCGKLEMELGELDDDTEFRSAMGLTEAGRDKVIRLSYDLLGLLSFFTTVSNEVKAWTIRKETSVLKAAGKIHSDMEKGFIRAEVIGHDDLVKCGDIAEARKRGLLQLEGKNYIVQDGDVITILFNI